MKEIATALIEAQKELPLVIAKEADGIVRGGKKSKYASFENIIEKIRPILNKHGIALLQAGKIDAEGKAICHTILVHTSGEMIEGEWPVYGAKDNQLHPDQCLGLGLTYARRYSLPSILGIGTGEQDLDASEPPNESPSEPPSKKEQTFSEWFDIQITHYRAALGNTFDAEVERAGIGDIAALKTRGEALALLDKLKSAVNKQAVQGG